MKITHHILSDDEIKYIENHINDNMHKSFKETTDLIYESVKHKKINKKQFEILCIYFFHDWYI